MFVRTLFPLLATLALAVGCAAETGPDTGSSDEPVHVQTADDFEEGQVDPKLRCRSGRPPTYMTCCNASDGCARKYGCWAC